MDNKTKKDYERHCLNQFIKIYLGNEQEYTITDHETPDFILKKREKNIAIEVTDFIIEEKIERESLENKIVSIAKEEFNKKYPDELYVLINFSIDPIQCKASEINTYASNLLKMVESMRDKFSINSQPEMSSFSEDFDDSFIHSIDIITDRFDHWQPFGAFTVDKADYDLLIKRIQKKETDLKQYQDNFKECWLLIVANKGHESSTHNFSFSESAFSKTYFNHIFLYKYMDNSLQILK